jgi:hypothetical protein
MCSPLIFAGIQAGVSIAGGIAQQKAAKQAAIQAQREAIYAQQVAAAETEQIRYNNKRDLATIRAAFGKRGVAFDSASMIDVIAEAAGNLDYPAVVKEHEGILARYKGNAQAAALKARGQNALVSSLLGGAFTFGAEAVKAGWFSPANNDKG